MTLSHHFQIGCPDTGNTVKTSLPLLDISQLQEKKHLTTQISPPHGPLTANFVKTNFPSAPPSLACILRWLKTVCSSNLSSVNTPGCIHRDNCLVGEMSLVKTQNSNCIKCQDIPNCDCGNLQTMIYTVNDSTKFTRSPGCHQGLRAVLMKLNALDLALENKHSLVSRGSL